MKCTCGCNAIPVFTIEISSSVIKRYCENHKDLYYRDYYANEFVLLIRDMCGAKVNVSEYIEEKELDGITTEILYSFLKTKRGEIENHFKMSKDAWMYKGNSAENKRNRKTYITDYIDENLEDWNNSFEVSANEVAYLFEKHKYSRKSKVRKALVELERLIDEYDN